MVYSFYANMGGIAIKVPKILRESYRSLASPIEEIVFVGNAGIESLLRREMTRNDFLDLSEEDTKSKSKANGIAKTFVCIQALWFIAQCLIRCDWVIECYKNLRIM